MESGNRGARNVDDTRARGHVVEDSAVLINATREVQGGAIRHTDRGVLLRRNLTTEGIDAVQSSQRDVTEATGVSCQGIDDDVVRERDTARKGDGGVVRIVDRENGIRGDRRRVGDDQHALIDADTTDDLPLDAWIGDRTRSRELTSRAEDERTSTRLDEARARSTAEGKDRGRGEGIARGDFDDVVGATEGNRTSRRECTGDAKGRRLDGRAIGGRSDRAIEDDGVGGVAEASIGRDDEGAAGDGDVPREGIRAVEDEATSAALRE